MILYPEYLEKRVTCIWSNKSLKESFSKMSNIIIQFEFKLIISHFFHNNHVLFIIFTFQMNE
ncbi:hypothetical protein DERP_013447 [Dermatophagoides pteronyssinus]|uniref:Uncharacterized protein n=1 Tax=Dermatophagoides pteronyssinus TaxID=6956 RepID=A0ABQ8JSE8_DERPT|nr:hypothetical protein DERP_013447 [Dermatophagoides pteronyssinus]